MQNVNQAQAALYQAQAALYQAQVAVAAAQAAVVAAPPVKTTNHDYWIEQYLQYYAKPSQRGGDE